MYSFLYTFVIIGLSVNAQELQITNLNNQPILILEKHPCKMQVGVINIIHQINITDLENTINSVTQVAFSQTNSPLGNIAKQKARNLYSNFNQIKPRTRQRRSIDLIGSAWKWIGGSPDAHDLQIINLTMNNLIDSNNMQFQINEQLGNRIKAITDEIKVLAKSKQDNEYLFNEFDLLVAIINIDTINNIIEGIQDAIVLSKASVTSNKLLTTQEITLIQKILENQGVKLDMPEEAINYVTPKIAVNPKTLLYILKVPELQKEESKIMQVVALNHNNSVINEYPNYLLRHRKTLFTTTNPEEYVQKSTYTKAFTDSCIFPLVMGTESHCIASPDYLTTTKLIDDNVLVINNANNHLLKSNCGPDDRSLSGNFLLTYSNCTIVFDNQNFTAKEMYTRNPALLGATYNIALHRQIIEKNLTVLDSRTTMNRKHIDHIYLQQSKNVIWNWSLLGGIGVTTAVTIAIVIFAYIYFTHLISAIIVKIGSRKSRHQNPRIAEDQVTDD